MLNFDGKTENGKLMVSNLFKLYDTEGLPFHIIFQLCEDRNYMPNWINLYEDAMKQGWKPKTFFSKIKEAIVDVYGEEFYQEVQDRFYFHFYFMEKEKQ